MARNTLGDLVSEVQNMSRTSTKDATIRRGFHLTLGDLAAEFEGTHVFQTLVEDTVPAGVHFKSFDFSLDTSKHIAVSVAALTLVDSSGIRYTPTSVDFDLFHKQFFKDMKTYGVVNIPEYFTHHKVTTSEGGKAEVYFYPQTDREFTATLLVNFVPHFSDDDSEYIPMARVVEPVAILGVNYFLARLQNERLVLEFEDEYEDAKKAYRRALAGGSDITVEDTPHPSRAYVRLDGAEPLVAWDNRPAIPYDPADPTKGFET